MRKIFATSVLTAILTITSVLLAFAPTVSATTAGFQAGDIMDDGVMINSNSMTVSQIQAFLNSKVPVCDTQGTGNYTFYINGSNVTKTGAQWAQYYYGPSSSRPNSTWASPPFTCLKDYIENGISSAQIIYNAAQTYQINPQALIVLLQKESGLVTDTWPTGNQYQAATGYGCPDTAPCSSQYYGLTNQLSWAAKLYHSVITQSPTWYSPYVKGTNFIQWNPVASCGGSNVNVQNWTTASLYDYTPYQPNAASLAAGYGTGDSCSSYGNRNFYSYFTDWFGSTQFPQPIGMILEQDQTGTIYLVDTSISTPIRYTVPDWATMQNYGLDKYPATLVSNATIQAMTNGGTLTSLVWDGNNVYLVNNQTRYALTSTMCTNWGLACSDGTQVKSLNSTFQTQYLKQGSLLPNLTSYKGTTYLMSSGMRQPVANQKSLSDLGLSSTSALSVSSVNANQPLGALLITTPGIVKFSPNNTIYYFNGTNYFAVPSMDLYYSFGLNNQVSLSVPTSSYNTTAPSNTLMSYWATDASNNKYIVNSGTKIPLSSSQQQYWSNASYTTGLSSLLSTLPNATLGAFIKSGVSYYALNSTTGDKHYITSMADYFSLGGNSSNTTYLDSPLADTIPTGLFAFPDGSLLKVGSDPALYVMNAGQLLYIPSMSILYAYNFNTSRLIVYPDAVQYPKGSAINYGQLPDGTVTIPSSNQLFMVSPNESTAYGLKSTNTYTQISQQFAQGANKKQISNLIRNSGTGDLYYASNGSLHHIGSIDTYKSLGGGVTPLTPLDPQVISLFIIGNPV